MILLKTRVALILAVALAAAPVGAQQPAFQLSSKFVETTLVGKQWNGRHAFGNVFCLTLPRGEQIGSLAEAMYNNNSLYFSRAAYENLTAIYVVASIVPAGRTAEVEISNLAAQNRRAIDVYPANFSQSNAQGALGSSLVLTVRNAREGGNAAPFPFVRPVDPRPDAPLASLSVHRLFVHGRDRIELAGLRYFKEPVSAEGEAQATAELAALVEEAAESLQSCTAKLPPRAP